ncbi:MAG TPA: M20/M25/M40 family metallo-hydrolase [Gemmatimonadales bacterium]|nr:M20/M25/M40 family metallo-hydrolase [Gemmatimonadales bacterium]
MRAARWLRRTALVAGALAPALTPVAAGAQTAANAGTAYGLVAPAPPGFDRAAAQRGTETLLTHLIGLDTQNPPGHELLVARYLDSLLAPLPGVETTIVEIGGGRAHFVARLRAPRPSAKPVLIMAHMDVVGADTSKWKSPPFKATVRGGYLYGRGAIDDKGMLSAAVTAFEMLARRRDRLDRDVILLGTASEEGGDVGIAWLLQRRADLVNQAEFALNEGGRVRVEGGRVSTVDIQTTEKVYYAVTCTAHGPSGHGSVPLPDNALAALARAVARIHAWRPPVRLTETTRLYFGQLATIEPDTAVRAAMRTVATASDSAAIDRAAGVLSQNPLYNAVLRTGAALTLIHGGIRENVIPSEGKATFNVRIIPGEDIVAITRAIQHAASEPEVTCALDYPPAKAPPPSPVGTALYRAMERQAKVMAPNALVIPFLSTGATDGKDLRAIGIPTYGILPMPLPLEDELRMHGDNERVPVPALGWGTEYLYRVLRDVAERGAS